MEINMNLYYVEERVEVGVNILLEKNFVKFLILKFSNNMFSDSSESTINKDCGRWALPEVIITFSFFHIQNHYNRCVLSRTVNEYFI